MPIVSGKYARQMAMAMEIPMSPIAGGWMGSYVDEYFRTKPWFTLILGVCGFIHSILTIVRIYKEMPHPPAPPSSNG
ncbi:MAG TPA: AtpZ/AtpI family protein [Candidatus Binataceae bacterium]|nr:AtpZ/AtpI family protein [Candidatus Binataceae bacterium]